MKFATLAIFGKPIPTTLLPLAQAVDKAIIEAERSTHAAQGLQRQLLEMTTALDQETERRLSAEYLHSRNQGGHSYPFLGEGTSDCEYCECCMGPFRSGGPEGVDPFGDCPGNPKLRDAYNLIQRKAAEAKEINS